MRTDSGGPVWLQGANMHDWYQPIPSITCTLTNNKRKNDFKPDRSFEVSLRVDLHPQVMVTPPPPPERRRSFSR